MATKKKSKAGKKTAANKKRQVKKVVSKTPAAKKAAPRKSSKKRPALKKASAKAKTLGKKTARAETEGVRKNRAAAKTQNLETEVFASQRRRSPAAGQSGDLQGLSDIEAADSESVGELLEEGNAFEADAVAGVQRAGDTDEEVHTHEVPEDDVPSEYLDEE